METAATRYANKIDVKRHSKGPQSCAYDETERQRYFGIFFNGHSVRIFVLHAVQALLIATRNFGAQVPTLPDLRAANAKIGDLLLQDTVILLHHPCG
ncbi:hypothetical protein [Bradyrhizobium cosmicum]|uniref:hypothetical protein n=1 Tax=Bradyrhizobium cosmicum TaxID=1404864 RepID=UPI0028E9175E|nr:hypothetical protein [Bradyrhizobium cosmicum]